MKSAFSSRLLAWYDRHRRELPWRETREPWAIWVSEIMLQQTRVETVRQIYERFMAVYPTPADFARVDDDELLAAWQGLGYYRRARNLRAGARIVMEEHGGIVPVTPGGLAQLPGIGKYTTGAIASIAHGLAIPAIDGNAERVFARHEGIREQVKASAGAKKVWQAAQRTMDPSRPGDFNQAVMELGATLCTPTTPSCLECPVAADCRGLATNTTQDLPVLPRRRKTIEVRARAVLVPLHADNILGYRIPPGEINAGQVDLPGPGPLVSVATERDLEDLLREAFGLSFSVEGSVGRIRHGITHHRVQLAVHWASVAGTPRAPLLAAAPGDRRVPWTTLARKAFTVAGIIESAESDG